ncbi:MAG: hypothetical protein JWO48_3136 [Bryobacterales bacterium]|nr:hypothetical protein [Bryobacterales bacterium]
MRKPLAFSLAAALAGAPLWGQDGYQANFDQRIQQIITIKKNAPDDELRQIEGLIQLEGSSKSRAFLAFAKARRLMTQFDFAPIEDARTDKQIGSTAGTAGSTSVVSKGAVPSILGFAVENGALTQEVSGTTFTFRGDLIGTWDVLRAKGFVQAYDEDSRATRFLRRFSYAFALDTSRQPTPPIATAGSSGGIPSPGQLLDQLKSTRQELANWSARVDLLNRRDSRDAANQVLIGKLLDTQGQQLLEALDFEDTVLTNPAYRDWKRESAQLLADSPRDGSKVQLLFYQQQEALRLLFKRIVPNVDEAVDKALGSYSSFNALRKQIFDQMKKKQLLAFEYINTKQVRQTDLSTFRLIQEGQFRNTRLDLTANFAVTAFNGDPALAPGMTVKPNRLHDLQFAGQADLPLGDATKCMSPGLGIGNIVLSFAFLLERLPDPTPVVFGGYTFIAEKGNIAVGQVKLTIPVKGTGVKIPLSFSFANRTELIREKHARANVGLTFDFDSIAALVGGK